MVEPVSPVLLRITDSEETERFTLLPPDVPGMLELHRGQDSMTLTMNS
jgi:hypothetical protein